MDASVSVRTAETAEMDEEELLAQRAASRSFSWEQGEVSELA